MNYLLSVGKKRIAFINSSKNYSYSPLREKGFRDALKASGNPVNDNWIIHLTDIDFNVAFSVATTLLSSCDKPDAIFCASDVYACAALKAAHTLHLSIPEDVAVMGFDNVNLTTMTVPTTISTVSQPTYQPRLPELQSSCGSDRGESCSQSENCSGNRNCGPQLYLTHDSGYS